MKSISATPLSPQAARDLFATALLSLLPFLGELPLSMALLMVMLLLIQGWLVLRERPQPSRALLVPLALAAGALCLHEFHTVFGREPGIALLTLCLPLKLLESRERRDARAALLLCCFMMTGQFLNAQSPAVAATVMLCALAIIATSARLERPEQSRRDALRGAARLLAGALPLTIVLFLLFPRIDGPLWRMPGDAAGATTGLGDTMEPGSISSLVLSGAIAFRAEFDGAQPPPRERYWRGPVLVDFDGRVWRERRTRIADQPAYVPTGPAYRYALTLEAHNAHWMLALDFPAGGLSDARYSSDFSLLSIEPVRSRRRIELQSYPATRVGTEEPPERLRAALALPARSNPRTVAAGRQILNAHAEPASRLEAAISFLRDARLSYTLSPPLLGEHQADEFLFDTRQGFCEHFASAFVILARAAGLPARIVTGYQGGEFNPLDGTLVVRQSDAHAWTEVWLEGRGWVRVDPTATSMPARIDGGIGSALQAGEPLPLMLRDSPWIRGLRYRWEAISNGWNQWVLGYNANRQAQLLRSLGLPDADWRSLTLALGASASLWIGWLVFRLWPRRRQDALDRVWTRFCRKLARRGLVAAPWEPAGDFAHRAADALPDAAEQIRAVAESWSNLRFGRQAPSHDEIRWLRRTVRHFDP